MDEQLKARLIGAAALVLLAVVLIPELLSSHRPSGTAENDEGEAEGVRSITIDLGGTGGRVTPSEATRLPASTPSKTPANAAEAGAADGGQPMAAPAAKPADVSRPVSAKAAPEARDGAAAQTPVAAKPEPLAVAKPKPPPAPAAAVASGWSVQVGAFRSSDSAQKVARDLKEAGFSAYVIPAKSDKGLNRVRVGPEPDKEKANELARRLKARGLPVAVVSNR